MYYNDYGYNYGYSVANGILGGVFIFYYLFILAFAVVEIIGMWKMFEKAGRKGWEAIIPFYNMYVLFEISGYPGLYILFLLIPCVGPIILFVFEILAYISLSKKFNKSSAFAVLLIFVSAVGFCILGFGNDEYDPTLGEQKNTQSNNNVGTESKTEVKSGKFCGNCGTKVSANAKVCSNCGNKLQ